MRLKTKKSDQGDSEERIELTSNPIQQLQESRRSFGSSFDPCLSVERDGERGGKRKIVKQAAIIRNFLVRFAMLRKNDLQCKI